jgi:hypothetical protein
MNSLLQLNANSLCTSCASSSNSLIRKRLASKLLQLSLSDFPAFLFLWIIHQELNFGRDGKENLRSCLDKYREIDPKSECFGPGLAVVLVVKDFGVHSVDAREAFLYIVRLIVIQMLQQHCCVLDGVGGFFPRHSDS